MTDGDAERTTTYRAFDHRSAQMGRSRKATRGRFLARAKHRRRTPRRCALKVSAVRSVGSPPGAAPVEARRLATVSDPRLHRSLLRASGSATDRTPEANRSSRSLASGATEGLRDPGSRRRAARLGGSVLRLFASRGLQVEWTCRP